MQFRPALTFKLSQCRGGKIYNNITVTSELAAEIILTIAFALFLLT